MLIEYNIFNNNRVIICSSEDKQKAVPQSVIKHSHQGEIKLVLDWDTASVHKAKETQIKLTKNQTK